MAKSTFPSNRLNRLNSQPVKPMSIFTKSPFSPFLCSLNETPPRGHEIRVERIRSGNFVTGFPCLLGVVFTVGSLCWAKQQTRNFDPGLRGNDSKLGWLEF